MENLSRSYSKRSYHGNGFTTKTSKSLYDDVFGGPPKLGVPSLSPRLEDYAEIFGGFHSSRASSAIPILDLPPADDEDELPPLDVRSSQFDYTQIFGGFNVVDFALSFEDLLRQSSAGYNSSDEAWSPAQSESLSDDSDPSAFSERSESLPYADMQYSDNDVKQFNFSYQRPNERSDVDASDGMAHLTRLQTKPSQLPPPSRPPPAMAETSQPNRPNPRLKPSNSYACERILDEAPALFIDVEVDTSSSTEIVKDAKAKAQAKDGSTKESVEEKKQDLKSCKQHLGSNIMECVTSMTFDIFDNEKSVMYADAKEVNGEEKKLDTEKEKYEGRYKGSGDKTANENVTKHGLEEEKRDDQQKGDAGGKGKNSEQEALEINKNESRIKESLWEEDAENTIKWESTMNEKNLKTGLEQEEHKGYKEVDSSREDRDKISYAFKWEHCSKQFPTAFQKEEPEELNQNNESEERGVVPCSAFEGNGNGVRVTKFQEQEKDDVGSATTSEVEVDNISEEADELVDIDWIVKDHCKLEELSEHAKKNEMIEMDGENKPNIETVHVSQMSENDKQPEIGVDNLLIEERVNSSCEKQENLQHKDVRYPPCLDGHMSNYKGAGIDIGKSHTKMETSASQIVCHPENIKATTFEWQKRDNIEGSQFTIKKEVTKEKFSHQIVRDWSDSGKKNEEASSADLEYRKPPSQTDQRNTNKSTGREEVTLNVGRIRKELNIERLAKGPELEDEYLKKIEEEREREREREKDRMAVSRDALERSYAVDRSGTELGQKMTVDSRGRLEKSFAWKASTEARLRAERAAVERATAEARQRAFEKAMAEKAVSDARERIDRSYSDRFSGSTEMRTHSFSSNLIGHQNPQPSKLRYSYSSANAGIEGESPQRCKARIERYQRTAERAAKALAEKNMRDLVVQREQAERNRLAEALDAEVKRWSSGKEGNLRALLSTLQYILGPDSGWQPVPLTDVITSAAVKKAYRKATLCVHPDKLQQRGASIQQKYVCEKVFDLLKEAWSKFNSEER